MSTAALFDTLQSLDAYWASVPVVRLKNCGTGAGGFGPGNTCGRHGGANSHAGGKRRRTAGKKRRSRGPDSGIGPGSRAIIRQRKGRHRASQRQHEHHVASGQAHPDHGELHHEHVAARRDLAHTLRDERRDLHQSIHVDRREMATELRGERRESRHDQAKERRGLARDQKREVGKLERTQGKEQARLEARHATQLATAKDPARLAEHHAAKRDELATEHREARESLDVEHRDARRELLSDQREVRSSERDYARDRIADLRSGETEARNSLYLDHRERVHDLRTEQRRERADLHRTIGRDEASKAFPASVAKLSGAPDAAVPKATVILTRVLDDLGHTAAWEAGTLDGREHLDVLHGVRLEARAWLRAQAAAVLEPLEAKALFGAAREVVARFFGKARGFIKEAILAGVLAIAGPGPMTHAMEEGIERGHEQQLEYMDKFQAAVLDGGQPLDGTFVSRAEMYGSSVWGSSQEVIRGAAKSGGVFDQEMRKHYGKDTPCDTCVEQVDKGWQPIGTLRSVGDSICLSSCHCGFLYRKGDNGKPHIAGRGPLHRAAFGRTG